MSTSPDVERFAAETHLEVYRPYRGSLKGGGSGVGALLALGLRVAWKRKLALVVLYAFPLIATVVYSFFVYSFYAVETVGIMGQDTPALLDMLAKQAMKNFEVRTQIVRFLAEVMPFALLTSAWYGTGLIANDLRAGALQLWFARPLGRTAYVFARFLTVGAFSSLAILVPALVILLVATVNSPDYSFVSDEPDLFWRVPAYGLLWVTITALVALAVSAVATKRTWALAGFFGVFLLPEACSKVLGYVVHRDWRALGTLESLDKLSEVVLAYPGNLTPPFPPGLAWLNVTLLGALAIVVVWVRIRRVEVVG